MPGRGRPATRVRLHELDRRVRLRHRTARADGAIESFVAQAHRLGLVRHPEPGVEIGLERELTQQCEAERVDGADADLTQASSQIAPALGIDLADPGGLPQPGDDALPHLGGGLAREGDREDT